MTKVSQVMVKCDKCGKESLQLLGFSVNFGLGSREDNEALMRHMQKCPHCGYEAVSISQNNDREEARKIREEAERNRES